MLVLQRLVVNRFCFYRFSRGDAEKALDLHNGGILPALQYLVRKRDEKLLAAAQQPKIKTPMPPPQQPLAQNHTTTRQQQQTGYQHQKATTLHPDARPFVLKGRAATTPASATQHSTASREQAAKIKLGDLKTFVQDLPSSINYKS